MPNKRTLAGAILALFISAFLIYMGHDNQTQNRAGLNPTAADSAVAPITEALSPAAMDTTTAALE